MPEIDYRDRHGTRSVTLPNPATQRPPAVRDVTRQVRARTRRLRPGTGDFAFTGLLSDIAGDVGVSIPTAGLAISTYALGVVVGAPVIAAPFARAGWRLMLTGLMLVFALGNLLTALSPGFGLLVLARLLAGLPHGTYFGFAALATASMALPGGQGKAFGRVMLRLSLVYVLGVPLATWAEQLLGWRVVPPAALADARHHRHRLRRPVRGLQLRHTHPGAGYGRGRLNDAVVPRPHRPGHGAGTLFGGWLAEPGAAAGNRPHAGARHADAGAAAARRSQ